MPKAVWIFFSCIISNSIITAMPPQMPLLLNEPKEMILSATNPGETIEYREAITENFAPDSSEVPVNDPLESYIEENIQRPMEDAIQRQINTVNEYNLELIAEKMMVPEVININTEEIKETESCFDGKEGVKADSKQIEAPSEKSLKNDIILSKIETALSKSKENRICPADISAPNMVPIFKPRRYLIPCNENSNTGCLDSIKIVAKPPCECSNDKTMTKINSVTAVTQTTTSQDPNSGNFKITGLFLKPLCNDENNLPGTLQNTGSQTFTIKNLVPLTETTNLRSLNIISSANTGNAIKTLNTVPVSKPPINIRSMNLNSVSQFPNQAIQYQTISNANNINNSPNQNPVIVIYKPQTITLEQFYGEFLKKMTMTVLVPFYVSRLNV